MTTWTAELYEDPEGRRSVEKWMNGLGPAEFESPATAIEEVLQKRGLGLAGTAWLKALGEGLYEFRVRHDAAWSEGGHPRRLQTR
jgi:hypothetical protein